VPKVGPSTAVNLIKEYGSLEKVVEFIENDPKKKYTLPDDWPYKEARELFKNPDVRPADHEDCEFEWKTPDIEGLVQFLVHEKGFSEDRVRSTAEKLKKQLKVAQQARLEGFFKVIPKTEEEKNTLKRKADEKRDAQKKKQKLDAKAKKEAKSKPRGTA
jgi:flap endonuclease-1